MGRTKTSYEVIRDICLQLEKDGTKLTAEQVAERLKKEKDIAPSKSTLLEHLARYRQERTNAATAPGISEGFILTINSELAECRKWATEQKQREITALSQENSDLLQGLKEKELHNEEMTDKLLSVQNQLKKQQAENQKLTTTLDSTLESTNQQIHKLEQERRQLIQSGEAARTQTAKLQLQLEHTIRAADSAESREESLRQKIDQILIDNTELQKAAAVSDTRITDLVESINDFKHHNNELKSQLETSLKDLDTAQQQTISSNLQRDHLSRELEAEKQRGATLDLKIEKLITQNNELGKQVEVGAVLGANNIEQIDELKVKIEDLKQELKRAQKVTLESALKTKDAENAAALQDLEIKTLRKELSGAAG